MVRSLQLVVVPAAAAVATVFAVVVFEQPKIRIAVVSQIGNFSVFKS